MNLRWIFALVFLALACIAGSLADPIPSADPEPEAFADPEALAEPEAFADPEPEPIAEPEGNYKPKLLILRTVYVGLKWKLS